MIFRAARNFDENWGKFRENSNVYYTNKHFNPKVILLNAFMNRERK